MMDLGDLLELHRINHHLVIVTESPTSKERMKKIFDFIDDLLKKTGKLVNTTKKSSQKVHTLK